MPWNLKGLNRRLSATINDHHQRPPSITVCNFSLDRIILTLAACPSSPCATFHASAGIRMAAVSALKPQHQTAKPVALAPAFPMRSHGTHHLPNKTARSMPCHSRSSLHEISRPTLQNTYGCKSHYSLSRKDTAAQLTVPSHDSRALFLATGTRMPPFAYAAKCSLSRFSPGLLFRHYKLSNGFRQRWATSLPKAIAARLLPLMPHSS